MTMYANVWLCMTIHDHIWELFQKLFHTFAKFFKLLKVSEQFKIFHMIQMFLNFSYFFTILDFIYLCLPLITLVYLWFPLFTFVYLCSTDASMHKFCACLLLLLLCCVGILFIDLLYCVCPWRLLLSWLGASLQSLTSTLVLVFNWV